MTLGQRIQELRKAHDLSQEALGEKLGVSRQAISRWEMDGAVPEVDKLIQLAKLFGVSLNDLLQVETGGGEAQSPIVLAPPRGWKLWNIILTLLTAAALISTAVLGWRNAALLERQAALEARLAQQQEILAQQSAALEQPGLDPSVPLVSDFRFDISTDAGTYRLSLELLPRQLPEGLTVTFVLKGRGINETLTASRSTLGSYYTAGFVLPNPCYDPFTISARFSDGNHEYTQALVRIDRVVDSSYTWDSLWDQPD